MASKRVIAPAQPDPSAAANRKVLAARAERMATEATLRPPAEPPQESAAVDPLQFLTDEFDRKYFGERVPTISRVVYGPDPLLDDANFKDRIEKFGVEEVATASAQAIIDKGALAFPSPAMQSVTARAIRKFGVEAVASAFHKRVMQIPVRTIEVELDREDEVLGNPLREAVNRYGSPGFASKFMSEQCIAQLGMRGYRIVRDHGEPVKVGTLIMTEIPLAVAEKRREEWAAESVANVRESEERYQEVVERVLTETPGKSSASALARGEIVRANASGAEESLGQARGAGIRFEDE